MRKPRPLTDEEGEVRELLLEDMKRFRPAAEVLPPSLVAKLGIKQGPGGRRSVKETITIRLFARCASALPRRRTGLAGSPGCRSPRVAEHALDHIGAA